MVWLHLFCKTLTCSHHHFNFATNTGTQNFHLNQKYHLLILNFSKDKEKTLQNLQRNRTDTDQQKKNCRLSSANLSVVSVDRAVHAALCILDQILWLRETCSQTCRLKLDKQIHKIRTWSTQNLKINKTINLYLNVYKDYQRNKILFKYNSPSSYALAATLAAIWAEIFLIFENGGYISPLSKFSLVTCLAKASAVFPKRKIV